MSQDPTIYFGSFAGYDDMISTFGAKEDEIVPAEHEVLFASYGGDAYSGSAVVIFEQNSQLYEVNGSHCSCYGLEDQWKPEETTVAALALREGKDYLWDHETEAQEEYDALVDSLQVNV